MFRILPILVLSLTAVLPALAEDATGVGQLMQLHRAGEQQLRLIQGSPPVPSTAQPPAERSQRGAQSVQQRGAQQRLQERQRRDLLRDRQRARTGARTSEHPAVRQQRYRTEQQRQNLRFRLQQRQ